MVRKEVQIRRKEPDSHLPAIIIANSKKAISSYFAGRAPYRGLTREEELKYIPDLLGMQPEDRDYPAASNQYWAEFTVRIPAEGKVLDITLDDDGEPINVGDWIIYKWLLSHKYVGVNKQDAFKHKEKMFYIHDPDEAERSRNTEVKDRKKAYEEFIKLSSSKKKESRDKMSRMLKILSGVNVDKLTEEEIENRLDDVLNESPTRFYEVATDKDLDLKYDISEYLDSGVLRRIGTHILFGDDVVGESMEEAIQFFKSRSSNQTVTIIKSRHAELKGITPVTKDTTEE